MRKERIRLDYMLHNRDTFEDNLQFRKLYWKNNMDKIVNYFMDIRDKLKLQN